ncbi:PQQ-binding-like beta-propeller repeat protein [Epidermidibacterium keratini]|uniref:PQQ-binding-like beta-propeller repeat protein n=1 Tax=Epidermidibacterium keratini TaxID=1891644 RepID=A0A7L4YJN0_9ACTN|nr:PQQ-binding-like beta-propeller repeat protein [Epidermidibacterium keratini]QHB99053.1 PQQ-binding-like beta-propeller repeat protein [Epidermidibacterium keratini]
MLRKLAAKDRRFVDTLARVRKPKVKRPVIDGDRLLVTRGWAPPGSTKFFDAGDLRALSLADGSPVWEVTEEGTSGYEVGRLGEVIWWFGFFGEVTRLTRDGERLSRTELVTSSGKYDQFRSVQITPDAVVAATADSRLVWFADDGDISRTVELDGTAAWPAVAGGIVISGWNRWEGSACDGHFVGFDSQSGAQRWSVPADGYAQAADVIGAYARLLNSEGEARVVEAATGEGRKWSGPALGPILNSPTGPDEPIFALAKDPEVLVCLGPAPELSVRWQSTRLGAPGTSVCVVDDTVLVLTGDGRLSALDAADGSLGWQISLGAAKFGSPPESHVIGPGYLLGAPGQLVIAQGRSVAAYTLP